MEVPTSSSTAAETSRATELEVPKPPSTVSEDSKTETEPECPLHGASYDSMTHFGKKLTTLRLSKEYFEEADQGIIEYSELLTAENDKMDIILDEKMVNHMYTTEVFDSFYFGSPMAEKLLSQLDCPMMKRFWEMRTSPETFRLRNSNETHEQFRWSQSKPTTAQQAVDKGMVIMENGKKTIAVPMIGIISQLEELDFHEVRKELRKANRGISTPTVVAVLEGVLEHIYYDPLKAVREERLKEIEAIRVTRVAPRKAHRVKGRNSKAKVQETGETPSWSKSAKPGAPAAAAQNQTSSKAPKAQVSKTAKED